MREEPGLQQVAHAITALDRMVHQPSRLAVLTILRCDGGMEYRVIRRLTGLGMANLSNHLRKLEEAGLVDIGKRFRRKKPVTTVSLTSEGRTAIECYWGEMKEISRRSCEILEADASRAIPAGEGAGSAEMPEPEEAIHESVAPAGTPGRTRVSAHGELRRRTTNEPKGLKP